MALFNESAYLPSTTGKLPSGPWLVLAPHPDDEAFGMGGSLLLAQTAKICVDVIFLTDGRAANLSDVDLPDKREKEAILACKQLGIRNMLFWREIDRELSISPNLINRLNRLIEEHSYSTVFFPSPQEPHPDHRAAGVIAWETLRQLNFSATPISYEISVQAYTNQLIDITQVVTQKEKIMASYASQITGNHYIECILALNQSRTWSLPLSVSHAEAFYIWPKEDRPLNALLLSIASQQYSLHALPNRLPLVSVIMRTQSRPEFLREAIRSVAVQTYPNIELIVVNDGGIENYLPLVQEEAAGNIQNFCYKHLDTQTGRSHAANVGLEYCHGDFIIFLDDDDIFLPEHIYKLVNSILDHPEVKVVYTGVKCMDENKKILPIQFAVPFSTARLISGNYIPIHAALFSRSILDLGCKIDESLDVYEDWDFWIQASMFTHFLFIEGFSAVYRNTGQSGVGLNNTNKAQKEQASLTIIKKWLPQLTNDHLLALIDNMKDCYQKDLLLKDNLCKIQQQEKLITELSQQLQTKDLEIQEELNTAQKILTSTSWRLTLPLRTVAHQFKKFLM